MKYRERVRKNIFFSIILFLIIVVGIIGYLIPRTFSNFKEVENVWSGEVATSFSGGNGTADNPYQISRGEELAYFKQLLESNYNQEYYDKYYVLTNDINMNNKDFDTIGTGDKIFKGHLDGKGYTIKNLKIVGTDVIDGSTYIGLFTRLDNATIQNINLDEVSITNDETSNLYEGLLAGDISNSTTINNIAIAGKLNIEAKANIKNANIGSISGSINNSNFTNSYIKSTINVEDNDITPNSISPVMSGSVYNIFVDSNIKSTFGETSIYHKDNVPENYLDTLNNSIKGQDYKWVNNNGNYYLERIETEEEKSAREVSHTIKLHDSGIEGNHVYINDLESDYNYYMGLNYTHSDDSKLPTMENKNIYTDENLVNVMITYDGSSYVNGKELTGYISPSEKQSILVYFKVMEVNDNGTKDDKGDDYIKFELIDNPYTDRPKDMGFNGWMTHYAKAEISYDNEPYVRYVKVPITYEDNKPQDVVIDFNASWTYAGMFISDSGQLDDIEDAIGNFNGKGIFKLETEEAIPETPIYGELKDKDMDGYYTHGTITGNLFGTSYPSNSYDARGNSLSGSRCRGGWGSTTTCEYYQSAAGKRYDENTTYYELVNGQMTEADPDTMELPIVDWNYRYEDKFSTEDIMSGYYEPVSVNRGDDISGLYDLNGEFQASGTCNSNTCSYYKLIQYFNNDGHINYFEKGKEYYYMSTRDTNIVVLNSSLTNALGNTQNNPVTITGSYNGSVSGATWTIQNTYIIANDDLVIEHLNISSRGTQGETDPAGNMRTNRTLYGNYYNVKLGRGIIRSNNYVNFTSIVGGNASNVGSRNDIKRYRLMVESGFVDSISLTGTQGSSYGTVYVDAYGIYGSDYDRVKKDNSKLDIYYCAGAYWGSAVYKEGIESISVHTIVKSGKFGSARPTTTTGYDNSNYTYGIYVGGRSYGQAQSAREAIIEGGWTYNLIGGVLSQANNAEYNDSYIYVKGGEVDAVYGGAGRSETYGNRIIQVTGGTINYSIFGGSNGITGSNAEGVLTGSPYIYVGGNAQVGSQDAVSNNRTIWGFEAGSVFGIGNGRQEYDSIGTADNSYIIVNDNAHILRNIYGGGNYGAVGTNNAKNKSETIINILDGTIDGSIYGGGNRNGSGSTTKDAKITINMYDGSVHGSIYGGSNEEGIIYGGVTINVYNGNILTDVYGGGQGGTLNTTGGTFVRDEVNVNIGKTEVTGTPKISGSVYGGSAFGTINGTNHSTSKSSNGVHVTINNGIIGKSVFGGGKGNSTYTPYVLGDILVDINNGNIGNVFGANDAAGIPNGDITINLNNGTVGYVYGGGNKAGAHTNHVYLKGSTVTTIFGGSNESGNVDESNVITSGGKVETIFGGNNSGGETTTSNVTINGATITKYVYGGGRLATTGTTNVELNSSSVPTVYGGGENANVTNSTNVTQNGTTVTTIYGGSNAGGDIGTTNVIINHDVTDVYGGNNAGGISSETNITINKGTITNVYGGGNQIGIGNSNIKIDSATITNVYGGSNKSGDVGNTNISTFGNGIDLNIDNVYGGNNAGGTSKNAIIYLKKGNYKNIYGGGNNAVANGDTKVAVTGLSIENSIYGGGNQEAVNGNTTLYIYKAANIGKHVFGGGNHGSIGQTDDQFSSTVNIAGAIIGGNVYGGCNTSVVNGTTKVNIGYNSITDMDAQSEGDIQIDGTVFGGGEANESGSDTYDFSFISVTEGIEINIDGSGYGVSELQFRIKGSIFGSGNASSSKGPSKIFIKKLGSRENPNSAISIQRADEVTLDGTAIELFGTTDRTNEYSDIEYSLNRIKELKVKNGSVLLLKQNANMLEKFTSLVDIDGKEEKATVTIDETTHKVTKNVDNRLYMLAGKNLNVTTNENASAYGVVSGMTFLGMYQSYGEDNYVYGIYDDSKETGSEATAGDIITGGSYVLGLHATDHDITVDGYYTNYIDDGYASVTTNYVEPTPPDTNFYMWTIGMSSVNYEFTLTASRYSSLGTYELSMKEFSKGNTIFNVIGFNGEGLKPGVNLVDSSTVPKLAGSIEEANTTFGLSMKSETVEWTGHNTTKYLYDAENKKSEYIGDDEYVADNQDIASSLMFYLYHAKNITTEDEIGSVVITMQALVPRNAIEYDTRLITITITIDTKEYDEGAAYDASITYDRKYEMPSATDVNITNRSQFTAYFALAYPTKDMKEIYGNSNEYFHTLISNFALPVNTKITMIDYGADDTNPNYYYYIVDQNSYNQNLQEINTNHEATYRLSNFIKMDSTDTNNTYEDAINNDIYYHDELEFIYEEFIFIFDFENTDMAGERLDNTILFELRNQEGFSDVDVLGIRQNYMKYNLYDTSNVVLEEEAILDNNYFYLDIPKEVEYRTNVGYNETEARQSIVDTNYESSSMGINIVLYDSSDNAVSSNQLSGSTITIDDIPYYVDANGVYRIKLSDKVAKLTKNLVFMPGAPLHAGTYRMVIMLFASSDGLHNSSDKEPTMEEIEIVIVGNNNMLNSTLDEEEKLVIGETGLNINGTREEHFSLDYDSVLANPNIRLSIYKRSIEESNTTKFDAIPADKLFTDVLNETGSGLTPQTEYEYLLTTTPEEQMEIVYHLQEKLTSGTYRLVFKLYDSDQMIDYDYEYIIVRKNVT